MRGTINCTYETPCGWCTKWDKKCDEKVGCGSPQRGLRASMGVYDEALESSIYSAPCSDCNNHDKKSPECIKCGTATNFYNFRPRRIQNERDTRISKR